MNKYKYNPISAKNIPSAKAVVYEGKKYKSHNALSNHLKINSRRIGEALKSGKELAGVGGCVDETF
jgi:hypothetical protein